VEVLPFGAERTLAALEELFGAAAIWRMRNGERFVSDNGGWILDLPLGEHLQPAALALALSTLPGVVDHGLFLGMARFAYVASSSGVLRLERSA
jgi:ribose 5-phosphate isomerase A